MTEYKKIVFSCFLIFAVLVFLAFSKLTSSVVGYFGFYAYGEFVEVIVRIFPIAISLGLFLGFYRNEKANTYMTEVVAELKKVTWSSKKEVWAATVVVIIAVLISAVLLGLFDSLWSFLIRKFIQYSIWWMKL